MANPTTIPLPVRDIFAHVLQLCHYIEDGYVAYERAENGVSGALLLDWHVLTAKAKQVKTMVMETKP